LARAADERFALAVFVGTGGFAEEAELGVGIADAEDGLRAGAGQLAAAGAGGDFLLQDFERRGVRAIGRGGGRNFGFDELFLLFRQRRSEGGWRGAGRSLGPRCRGVEGSLRAGELADASGLQALELLAQGLLHVVG
jgi:hypothetical protein